MKLPICIWLILFLFSSILLVNCKSKKDITLQEDDEPSKILSPYGLANMKHSFSADSLDKMDCGLSYDNALEYALTSWLNDNSDVESPLALIPEAIEDYVLNKSNKQQHQDLLITYMNDSGTICSPNLTTDGCYPPEYGEDLTQNWVFTMQISDLSDHIFWAIVPCGSGEAYNYSFN